MAEETAIEWADSTLNIWEGCQETGSPACVPCYARERNLRYAPKGTTQAPNWGPHAPRREVKSWRSTLAKISRMAKEAFANGRTEPWFVFVNSLSDFWDNKADRAWRREALEAFREHPHLTFLLLTKRPGNIPGLFAEVVDAWVGDEDLDKLKHHWPRNIAIGATMVNQEEHDRDMQKLLDAFRVLGAAFVFVSIEPACGPIELAVEFMNLGGRAWVIAGGAQGRRIRWLQQTAQGAVMVEVKPVPRPNKDSEGVLTASTMEVHMCESCGMTLWLLDPHGVPFARASFDLEGAVGVHNDIHAKLIALADEDGEALTEAVKERPDAKPH